MTTPPVPQALSPEAAVTAASDAVFGDAPQGLKRLVGGMNNAIFQCDLNGRPLVAKVYFRHQSDPRDRLGTEFRILDFLWCSGTRCVPEPVGMSPMHSVGFYSYIEGARLATSSVTTGQLEEYAGFALRMHDLSRMSSATVMPLASEAAFSISDRYSTVARRLAWLGEALDPKAQRARSFLRTEASPLFDRVTEWAEQEARVLGVSWDHPVPAEERTLSQGDIGLHNCLNTRNGLVFHDFEYGGWDDAAQVMVQTCLAPAIPVAAEAHGRMLSLLIDGVGRTPFLTLRVRLNYPVLALKWGLIMLNELLDVGRARRDFSGTDVDEQEASRVSKARKMLSVARQSITPGLEAPSFAIVNIEHSWPTSNKA